MNNVNIIFIDPEDKVKTNVFLIQTSKLHDNYYKNSKRTPMILEYQYGGSLKERSVVALLIENNNVKGTLGMIPIMLISNGKEVNSGKSEMGLIDQSIRGKGLFANFHNSAIKKSKDQNMEVLWGFTKALNVFRKVNYHVFIGAMKYAIFPIKIKSTMKYLECALKNKSFISKITIKGIIALYSIIMKVNMNIKRKINFIYTNKLKDESDLIKFFSDLTNSNKEYVYIKPSMEFIKWRLYNNPSVRNYTEYLYENQNLQGYIFYSIEDDILKLISFHYKDNSTSKEVIGRIFQIIKSNNIGMVLYTGNVKNHLISKNLQLLKKNGFIIKNRDSEFIFQNLCDNSYFTMNNIENWMLDELWSEGI